MSEERPFLQIPCPNPHAWQSQQEYEEWLRKQKELEEEEENQGVIIIEI